MIVDSIRFRGHTCFKTGWSGFDTVKPINVIVRFPVAPPARFVGQGLLSNGIVWLEKPSDRVYFNRWVELCSDGGLREGRDYQCVFYGGSLLARTQFTSPETADDELINLLGINPNVVVVCDSDRTVVLPSESSASHRIQTNGSRRCF